MNARILIEATAKTPRVLFEPAEGLLEITGCSVHENADRFYRTLQEAVDTFTREAPRDIVVRIHLSYFNSSSAKYLLDILHALEDMHLAGSGSARVEWVHQEHDLDMEEAGNDYKSLLEIPVRLVARP